MSPSSSNLSNASPNFLYFASKGISISLSPTRNKCRGLATRGLPLFDNTVKDATRCGRPTNCATSFLGGCQKIYMASRQAGQSACSTQSIKSAHGLDDLLGQAFRLVGEFFNSVLAHFVLYGLHTDASKANTIGAGEIRSRLHPSHPHSCRDYVATPTQMSL